jgi:hypothetical protein
MNTPMTLCRRSSEAFRNIILKLKLVAALLLLSSLTSYSQTNVCLGTTTTVSITRSIGCGAGVGSNAQWDGAAGGTINDPGGMANDFTVTWTTTGTFRLKRTFPSGCASTVIYSSYHVVYNATGGTLNGGGTFQETVNTNLTLTGYSGNILGYYDRVNGGTPVAVNNTTATLNVSFTNSTNVAIVREYYASVGTACYKSSSIATVRVEPKKIPTAFACVGSTTLSLLPETSDAHMDWGVTPNGMDCPGAQSVTQVEVQLPSM